MVEQSALTGTASASPYAHPELYRPRLVYPDVAFHEMLERTAARWPEHPAIHWHEVTITYRELHVLARSAAAGLHALGLRKGDRLCLFLPNRPEYVIAWLGASMLGVVVSPMNPSYKEREVGYQLENTGAVAALVHRDLLPVFQAARSQARDLRHVLVTGMDAVENVVDALPFGRLLRESPPHRGPYAEVQPEDLLALPYSSGTTGLPKGVMLTHRNLVVNYTQYVAAARVTEQDVFIVYLPLYHIYGVALLGQAVFAGASMVLLERFSPADVLDLVRRCGVTVLHVVPPVLGALASLPNLGPDLLPKVRHIQSAAAPMPPEPARRVAQATGLPVLQAYGMTEASPITHHSPLEREYIRLESGGLPVYDTEQKVVDLATGADLPAGEVGEICVRGPQIMRGYWQAAGETARVLRDGWYYSGDVGYVDAQGYVYIVDRAKEMIKVSAWSVAPAELESVLLEHPAVREAAVIGVPDAQAGEVPRAYVALQPGQQVTAEQLMEFANGKLARYKSIRDVVFVENIPRTASGKILRRELKAQAQS
jgi:long-chain acyl-CoA synthetase